MPPTCQHSEPAETPPSTTPACHTSRKISSRPCTRHTASRLATLPPPTQTTSCASRCARRSATVGIGEQAQVAHLDGAAGEGAVDRRPPGRGRRRWPCRGSRARPLGRACELEGQVEDRAGLPSRRARGRGWRSPCWWRGSSVRRRASGSSGDGGRAQRSQDGAGRAGAAGHGALDGRGVAVVAADVEAVAEIDRPAERQRRERGGLGAGDGDRGEVLEVAGSDAVGARRSRRGRRPRRGRAGSSWRRSARPSGL